MKNTAKVTISLNAIKHNLKLVRQLTPGTKVLAMVKANAYGHGLIPIAKALEEADGLAVARLSEALQLRDAGIEQRLVVLGSLLSEEDIVCCSDHQLDVVVHDQESANLLLSCMTQQALNVWLKIDTGMHRLGVTPADFEQLYSALAEAPQIREIITMTHLSCADEVIDTATEQQLATFKQLTDGLPTKRSVANSAAIIRYRHAHYDWVRPGIMLYGADPLLESSGLPIKPAMSLTSKVIAIRDLQPEEAVGYGCTWQAEQPTRLATVGIGYGDGYPRHAKNGTPVLINNQVARLAGRVSMDLITVDITDCDKVSVGDEVVLWNESLKANEIARNAETISYELFTSVSERVDRKII